MAQQSFDVRVLQKGDTDANWELVPTFVPLKNEIICYTTSHRFKVGDGVTQISSLPFWGGGTGESVEWTNVLNKPFSTLNSTQFGVTSDRLNINTNQPNGLAQLNASGKLESTYLPTSLIQGSTISLTSITSICTLDRAEYDALATHPASTLYIIRG